MAEPHLIAALKKLSEENESLKAGYEERLIPQDLENEGLSEKPRQCSTGSQVIPHELSESGDTVTVSCGTLNAIKANAPDGSKPQFNILINNVKNGASGWYVWKEDGDWYHLGGGKGKDPTIYKLNTKKDGYGWDRSRSYSPMELYNKYGKAS